ncbi:MAG: SctK family type III secretion system sorting platform protein [Puniceicoccales bacterium]|jgi:hypothetical protein|nr:SctK family type III secretion system sorting platform protein [Puniceicoccales bacterium]
MDNVAVQDVTDWKDAWKNHGEEVARLLRFLYEPVSHMHPSRLLKIFPDAATIHMLAKTRRGWLHLNAMALKKLNLPVTCPMPFLESRQALVYEQPSLLERLSLFLGVTLFAEDIKRVVRRSDLRDLVETFGEDVYVFAMRKSSFFRTHQLPFSAEQFAHLPLKERIVRGGKWCITGCCDDLPPAIKKRFPLKFHRLNEWPFPDAFGVEEVDRLWQFVKRMLQRCK